MSENRNRLLDTENKLMVAKRKGAQGWVKKVKVQTSGYKINDRDVMYSTGNTVNNNLW